LELFIKSIQVTLLLQANYDQHVVYKKSLTLSEIRTPYPSPHKVVFYQLYHQAITKMFVYIHIQLIVENGLFASCNASMERKTENGEFLAGESAMVSWPHGELANGELAYGELASG
jgi:hypothetical protein